MRLLLAILLAASPAGAQMTQIGVAAAVAGKVQAVGQGQAVGRVVHSGKPLFLNERVTTDAAGRLQVMLLDETVFTVGPNSDLTLDEFVYDPATSAGKVTAKVTKGVFRMVTGKIARRQPDSVKVKMPVGTMGIRGTIVGGQVDENGSTIVLLGPGAANNAGETPGAVGVENAGGEVSLDKPGFGTTVNEGQPPAPPSDMSAQMGQMFGGLDSGGGEQGSGGGEGENSAAEQSGEETAAGGESSGEFSESADLADDFENAAAVAAQEETGGFIEGIAAWEDILQIETGSGTYYGSGTASCSGGGCLSSSVYTDFQINIDFGSRTIGDSSSNSAIHAYDVNTVSDDRGGYINSISFDALSGDATLTLGSGDFTALNAGDNLTGTTITLLNSDGGLANAMTVDLNLVNTSPSFSVTGPVHGEFVLDEGGGCTSSCE